MGSLTRSPGPVVRDSRLQQQQRGGRLDGGLHDPQGEDDGKHAEAKQGGRIIQTCQVHLQLRGESGGGQETGGSARFLSRKGNIQYNKRRQKLVVEELGGNGDQSDRGRHPPKASRSAEVKSQW